MSVEKKMQEVAELMYADHCKQPFDDPQFSITVWCEASGLVEVWVSGEQRRGDKTTQRRWRGAKCYPEDMHEQILIGLDEILSE